VIAVVAVAAAVAGASAAPIDRTLEANGVPLHIVCAGERLQSRPLVVLEAGAGNGASTWNDVVGPIAQFARVCAYDRQNLGSSAHVEAQLTAVGHVAALHALLEAAHEPPPYVMAGHSYGGMIVRLYASTYPAEVAGLVLVDSSHEDQIARFALLPPPAAAVAGPPQPPRERIDLPAASAELAAAAWRADIPLVVLSRGLWFKTQPPTPDPLAATRLGIWQDLHRELATRSRRSELVVATRSGHYIQNDEPEIVVNAVRHVMKAVVPPEGR